MEIVESRAWGAALVTGRGRYAAATLGATRRVARGLGAALFWMVLFSCQRAIRLERSAFGLQLSAGGNKQFAARDVVGAACGMYAARE